MKRAPTFATMAFTALFAWLAIAALHDVGTVLLAPLAPLVAWMLP